MASQALSSSPASDATRRHSAGPAPGSAVPVALVALGPWTLPDTFCLPGSWCGLGGGAPWKGPGWSLSWPPVPSKLPSSRLSAAVPSCRSLGRGLPLLTGSSQAARVLLPEGSFTVNLHRGGVGGRFVGEGSEEQVLESHKFCHLRPAVGTGLGSPSLAQAQAHPAQLPSPCHP